MKETVCLVSLGCPKNLVDSEVILGLFSKKGYPLTTDLLKADILIVNTCAFIEAATQEAIETILRLSRLKKDGHCRLLIVSGCLPQRYGPVLEKELPEVDYFVGTGGFQNLPALLETHSKKKSYLPAPSYLYNERTPRVLSTPPFMAYLKIAEGCSNACTFCSVPKIRGPYQSRKLRSVFHEAKKLADRGVRELILIAQDTTAYGKDLRNGTNLEKLLKQLVTIDGLRWIRILYAYPRADQFTESLLELMAREEKICSYLDLPIQHIDDVLLKRMGRKSRGADVRGLLKKIRAFLPDVSLRSSLIVGFPGETERQFKTLLDFVEETRFDHLGVFPYSPEQGTPAAKLLHPVSKPVTEDRFRILMETQKKISLKKHQAMKGRKEIVLVEGPRKGGEGLRGRLRSQAPEIDGSVLLSGQARPGDWVEARITRALPYDLIARIEEILPG